MRQREDRIAVSIKARMRADSGWSDVVIRNVSPRGMLVHSPNPPRSGTYVEIHRGRLVIVARSVWSQNDLAGIRLQDRVQIDALLGRRLHGGSAAPHAPSPASRSIARLAERSRSHAAIIQYVALAMIVAGAAAGIAQGLTRALAEPLAAVRLTLGEP